MVVLQAPGSAAVTLDAVIFDMDGLLIDSEDLSIIAWRDTLARYGVTLDEDGIRMMFGMRIIDDAVDFVQRYHLPMTPPELVRERQAYMLALVERQLQPMPGAVNLVRWLQRMHVPLALATSGETEYAARCLAVIGLTDAFALRVTGDDVVHGKPAPDIFLLTAQRLGITPARCLVLEDAPHGVAAAVAASMPVIAVPNHHTEHLTFPPVTGRAASLTEVQSWLTLV